MKKSPPWQDIMIYGGLTLVSLICLAVVLTLDIPLPGIITLAATSAGFLAVFLVFFIKWVLSKPDFVTLQYVGVWTDGQKEITKELMDKALKFYKENLPEMSGNIITCAQISNMLGGATIEWKKGRVSAIGIGWQAKDKAGLQSGKSIMVQWKGSISASALFHELHHMIDQCVLCVPCDYKHERLEWWSIVDRLKIEFAERIENV